MFGGTTAALIICVISALHIVGSLAVWRIAHYLCLHVQLLAFIPIVNLVYLCYVYDRVSVESYDCEYSVASVVAGVAGVVVLVSLLVLHIFHYDVTIIVGRILFLTGICVLFVTISMAYVVLIWDSFRYPILWVFLSVLFTPCVILLIASFKIHTYVEEGVALYGDVDIC